MSALVASLALATALSRHSAPSALVSRPIVCAPNADISSSGCGNVGIGNSGAGNTGNGNSGAGNTGNGNSGFGNTGNGNSGCGNVGIANSGAGNVGVGLSGGTSCPGPVKRPPPTTPPTTSPTESHSGTTLGAAGAATQVVVATLPLTGRNSTGPLTLAVGLMLSGGAVVTLANRRRHAVAAATGGELLPLSAAVGLLLTGRAHTADGAPRGTTKS